jgi:hypothetical protein
MSAATRFSLVIAGFVLVFAASLTLASRGVYGWTLFAMLPMSAGALGVWFMKPESAGRAIGIGAAIGAIGCVLFLVAGAEGLVCMAMALPIVVPLSVIGSLLAYWSSSSGIGTHGAAMCLLLPASFMFDTHATPPVYSVKTSIVVNAPAERVWSNVVAFPAIPDEPDWVLRTGLAYPIATRLSGSGVGAPRRCDLSTGTVEERVVIWDEPNVLRFEVTSTPPSMRELGLYGRIQPRHLNGYYVSREGEFELTPLSSGRTLVTGTSWYQHGMWPAEYWRQWSDLVVHHIHRRVLEHIRDLSQAGK